MTSDWHQKLMQALKESKAGKSTSLQELSQIARREIISDQYLSPPKKTAGDGSTFDYKMRQAGKDE